MSEGWLNFLQRWVVVTLGVVVAAHIVPGIHYDSAMAVIVASLALGLLNALRPFFAVLTLPLLIFTLGLFWFVLNALLLWLVGYVVKGFHVDGFWPAFFGGLVISFVSLVVNLMLGRGPRVEVRQGRRPPGGPNSPGTSNRPGKNGGGPFIDV